MSKQERLLSTFVFFQTLRLSTQQSIVNDLLLFDDQHNITNIHRSADFAIYSNIDNQQFYFVMEEKYKDSYSNADMMKNLTPINYFRDHGIKIKKICTNIYGNCVFWITSENKLYANGINNYYKLGLNNIDQECVINKHNPVLLDTKSLKNVVDVQSATEYSIALCQIKNVNFIIKYWIKTNVSVSTNQIPNDIINLISKLYGLISTVYATPNRKSPYLLVDGWIKLHLNNENIFQFIPKHTVKLITKFYGILGDNYTASRWEKISIFDGKQIAQIKCGYNRCLILDYNGLLWTFGSGEGVTNPFGDYSIPYIIPYFRRNNIVIRDIAQGLQHNIAIDINDKIYAWGVNRYGQCGTNPNYFRNKPKMIQFFKNDKIKRIDCGSNHNYAQTKDGRHFLWGHNRNGQCLTKFDINDRDATVVIPNLVTDFVVHKICNDKQEIKSIHLENNNTKIIAQSKQNV